MEDICLVSCAAWIRRGASKEKPDKVELTKEDLAQIIQETRVKLRNVELSNGAEDVQEDGEDETSNAEEPEGTAVAQNGDTYNMEQYENEEEETDQNVLALGQMTEFASNDDDPYVTLADTDDTDSEDDDLRVRPDDNLVVSGSVDGDASTLVFHVFNEEEGSMYVHHDILLGELPICVEWLNYEPGEGGTGSLVAVGSMSPIIEVWDADVINCFEPAFRLGRKAKKKKNKRPGVGHTDAVLSLGWNRRMSHVLASGSADQRVLLWDLDSQQPASTLSCGGKVQTLAWHPRQVDCLLSGDCAGDVRVWDCHTESSKTWRLTAEVERAVWDHFNPSCILASTDDGQLHYIDSRQEKAPLWSVQAHEEACSGLALSPEVPGCLVTVSPDKTLKVWDVSAAPAQLVHSRPMRQGRLHCLAFSPDLPWMTCVGGDNKENAFCVWDVRQSDEVRARFGSRPLTRVTPVPEEDEQQDATMETEDARPGPSTSETPAGAASAQLRTASGKKLKKRHKARGAGK